MVKIHRVLILNQVVHIATNVLLREETSLRNIIFLEFLYEKISAKNKCTSVEDLVMF